MRFFDGSGNPKMLIQEMTTFSAPLVTDFIYRIYGDTYPHACFYDEEQLLKAHSDGKFFSLIAGDESGRVVGIIVTRLRYPSGPLAFMDLIATDSEYPMTLRAHAVTQLVARFREIGPFLRDSFALRGLVSTETTVHFKTQRMMLRSRMFLPCGLFLGWMPGWSELIRNSKGSEPNIKFRRNSTVSAFPFRSQFKPYVAYIPDRYAALLQDLYREFSLPVSLQRRRKCTGGSITILNCSFDRIKRVAILEVQGAGDDCAEVLKSRLTNCCDEEMELIQIAIPLRERYIDQVVESLVQNGCKFAALIPGYFTDSDALVMQYINHPVLPIQSTDLMSPMVRKIFATF